MFDIKLTWIYITWSIIVSTFKRLLSGMDQVPQYDFYLFFFSLRPCRSDERYFKAACLHSFLMTI